MMLALLLWACVEPSTTDTGDTSTTSVACAAFDAPVQQGVAQSSRITEASGLVWQDDTLFVHNDSGAGPIVEAWTTKGEVLAQLRLDALAVDWEAMAVHDGALYVGDIGDNARARGFVTVYRAEIPAVLEDGDIPSTSMQLTYPDGPHDAEALLVDPTDGALVVVTKETDGRAQVYVDPNPTPGQRDWLFVAEIDYTQLEGATDLLVTGGTISPDGSQIVLRTYLGAMVWPRQAGQSLADALAGPPCPVTLAGQPQGETIAWAPEGLYSVSEGQNQPIYLHPIQSP